MLWGQLDVKPI